MPININRKDFYRYKCSPEKEKETRKRLQQINDMGMEEVGTAEFGYRDVMSGLYIEKVWNLSDKDFDDYMLWAKGLIQKHIKNET